MKLLFTKYRKSDSDTKVLLIYLLLNKYEINQIRQLEETEEDRMFGLRIKKIYGVTKEYVDVRKIEEEIESIQNPIICSPQSYEYYATSNIIHMYTPEENGKLVINDMDVISKIMVITEQCIVSSNIAKKIGDIKNYGFMFFYDYVIKSETKIGKWRMVYNDKVFSIFYRSEIEKCRENEELLYSAIEIDKTSTYKMVIYIIGKAAGDITGWTADNFLCETYELAVK